MEHNPYLQTVSCRRYTEDGWQEERMQLTAECRLDVELNGKPLLQLSCSPVEPEELAVGALFTGGYLTSGTQIVQLQREDTADGITVRVQTQARPAPARRIAPPAWDVGQLQTLFQYVVQEADLHRSSHSTHSCTLMRGGSILCCREDIGRHNAIDRAAGWCLLHSAAPEDCIAFLSARISSDAVRKAFCAGFRVLCAKALPTAKAVKLARETGLTLVHFSPARGMILF